MVYVPVNVAECRLAPLYVGSVTRTYVAVIVVRPVVLAALWFLSGHVAP